MKPRVVDYLGGYSEQVRIKAQELAAAGELEGIVLRRHPDAHDVVNNAALYTYVQDLKKTHMRSSPPLGKVRYSDKISTLHQALGLHTYAVRIQGGKLKRKNELRVASLFKALPASFLQMVVVHELAHLRHKDHDKAFYRLCTHMEPDYHRYELDLRLILFARQALRFASKLQEDAP